MKINMDMECEIITLLQQMDIGGSINFISLEFIISSEGVLTLISNW